MSFPRASVLAVAVSIAAAGCDPIYKVDGTIVVPAEVTRSLSVERPAVLVLQFDSAETFDVATFCEPLPGPFRAQIHASRIGYGPRRSVTAWLEPLAPAQTPPRCSAAQSAPFDLIPGSSHTASATALARGTIAVHPKDGKGGTQTSFELTLTPP